MLNRHEANLFGQNNRNTQRTERKQPRLHVFTHTNQPTNQPAPPSPGHWTALAPSGTFFSTKVAFSRLDTDFCGAAVARTMAGAPFCQPHIAADHRDMQRLWINYFTGNRTSPAGFFSSKH